MPSPILLPVDLSLLHTPSPDATSPTISSPVSIDCTDRTSNEILYEVVNNLSARMVEGVYIFDGTLLAGATDGQLTPVTKPVLSLLLGRNFDFTQMGQSGPRSVDPPEKVLSGIMSLVNSGSLRHIDPVIELIHSSLPTVRGIVAGPVFMADGRLLNKPGFDEESGLFVVQRDLPTMPIPGMKAKEAAAEFSAKIFADFPFVDTEADAANALALAISGLVRPMLGGLCPLFVVRAPAAGTGKTLLVRAIANVLTGQDPIQIFADDNAEDRKRLPLLRRIPDPIVLVDNISEVYGGPALRALATGHRPAVRILGSSQISEFASTGQSLVFTGNNIQPRNNEDARRSVLIELDAGIEYPADRAIAGDKQGEDFIIGIRENRAELLSLLVTLVQRWVASGMPPGEVRFPNFELWARIVGGIVEYAGVRGFLGNASVLRADAAKSDDLALDALIQLWVDGCPDREMSPKELINEFGGQVEAETGDKFTGKSLGKYLRLRTRHPRNAWTVVARYDPHTKAYRYRLRPADQDESLASN